MAYRMCRRTIAASFCVLGMCFASQQAVSGMLYTGGHGDIGIGYELDDPLNPNSPRNLFPHWHLGVGALIAGLPAISDQEFKPQEITAVVPLTSKFTNPGGPTWNFLGGSPNSDVYFLSQNNSPSIEIPFLGLASDELDAAEWNALTWSINLPQTAPGAFSIFSNGIFGPNVAYSSTLGISSFQTSVGSHNHFNLAFTQPGFYDLEFSITGTHATDGNKTSNGTFQFFVGDVSSIPEPNSILLIVIASASYVVTGRSQSKRLLFYS
ncbi:MAG: choice-of-anchor M domain-containing protein [Pirellulaceae bacterium]|nr:choice-of-anchor M domain-containing protein [Pirellulaceae bacterium]